MLFSFFICEPLEGGGGVLRVDLALACKTPPDGATPPLHLLMTIFVLVMIAVHVVGTPAGYAYLLFWKHREPLRALREQELADYYRAQLTANADTQPHELDALRAEGAPRLKASAVLPGYMRSLTSGAGYEYRVYWFEIFGAVRKVLLVGIPAAFSDRGGSIQLVWGLLVCFCTFGMYTMWAPYIKDSDDRIEQLSQLQIFLTLVASVALRVGSSPEMEILITAILFTVPCIAIVLETPLVAEARKGIRIGRALASRLGRASADIRSRVQPQGAYTPSMHPDAGASQPQAEAEAAGARAGSTDTVVTAF